MGGCWNWAMMVQGSAVLFKPSNGLTCPWYFHCLIINERKTARESPPVDHLPLNKAAHVAVSTFLALSLLLSFCNLILTQLYYYSVSLWVTFPLIGIWLFSVSLLILFQWTCLKRTHFLLRLCVIHASHFCNAWLTPREENGGRGSSLSAYICWSFHPELSKHKLDGRKGEQHALSVRNVERRLPSTGSIPKPWAGVMRRAGAYWKLFSDSIVSFFYHPPTLLIFKCIPWLLVLLLTFLLVSSTAQALPGKMVLQVLLSWGIFPLPIHSNCIQNFNMGYLTGSSLTNGSKKSLLEVFTCKEKK